MYKLLAAAAVAALAAAPSSAPTGAPPLLLVDYAVQAAGAEAPLLQGQVALEPGRPVSFERQSHSAINLQLEAVPGPGDAVLVHVAWEEKEDHDHLRWTPAVLLRPGAPATSSVTWSGGGRTLRLQFRQSPHQ